MGPIIVTLFAFWLGVAAANAVHERADGFAFAVLAPVVFISLGTLGYVLFAGLKAVL